MTENRTGAVPSEPEIMAFQRRCNDFYPPDAATAPVERQREWYDALCQAFDAPLPTGLVIADDKCGRAHPALFAALRPVDRERAAAMILRLHDGMATV